MKVYVLRIGSVVEDVKKSKEEIDEVLKGMVGEDFNWKEWSEFNFVSYNFTEEEEMDDEEVECYSFEV
jgi:hypothetical protein